MSLQLLKDLPIVGKSTPKCVFQAKKLPRASSA